MTLWCTGKITQQGGFRAVAAKGEPEREPGAKVDGDGNGNSLTEEDLIQRMEEEVD